MRMQTKLVLLGALSVLGVGAGCAGSKEASKDVKATMPFVAETREGLIVGVQGNTIAVSDVNKPQEPAAWFAISEKTKLEREGQRVELSQISEGTPVRVSFEAATGPEKANTVQVLTGQDAQEVQAKAQGTQNQPPPPPPPQNP